MHSLAKNKNGAPLFLKIALLFFCILIIKSAAAPYRCALVLSGGGARGLAQIGVLKALENLEIRPDLIVATSMGAIVGALYSSGFSADSIASLVRSVQWNSIYRNTSPRKSLFVTQKEAPFDALLELRFNSNLKPILPNAISHGQAFYDLLTPLLIIPQFNAAMHFDNLFIPLRILATNLMSGDKVVFSQGNITTAIRASCAVPLAFTPVDYEGRLLVDGGITANIPLETALAEGADFVIVVDVTSPLWKKDDLDNPVRLVDQIVSISRINNRKQVVDEAHFVIKPEIANCSNSNFEMIDTLIAAGFSKTMELGPLLKKLWYKYGDHDSAAGRFHPDRNIDHISISETAEPDHSPVDSTEATGGAFSRTDCIHLPTDPVADQTLSTIPGDNRSRLPVIKEVRFSGNSRTRDYLLFNAAGLAVGDTITPEVSRRVISTLYAMDLFENVNINLDSSGIATILAEEKKYLRLRMGLRFDDFHLGEGFVEPAYENCFGIGMIALMHIQYGLRREKYTLELSDNHLFTRNFATNLQFQLYSSKEKIREVDSILTDSVRMISTATLHEQTLRKAGLLFMAGTQIGRFSLLNGGIRLERFLVQRDDADMLRDLLGLHFKKTLPYLTLKLTMDSMDRFPYPTTGTKMYVSAGVAVQIFGGGYAFLKYSGSVGRYFTLFKIHTFYPMISFSWATKSLPEVERAYIGGATYEERYREQSVHNYIPFIGISPRTLIGDRFGICHFEYRCEIKKNLFAHVIGDWGTAWNNNDYNYQELIHDAPLGGGIGISYLTPFGPVRISYGQLFKNSNKYLGKPTEFFYFSAGHDF